MPVLAEQVFPVMFHTLARAGMTPAPKVMKESFQPLQLGTALGAAVQYDRELWICADLWGPDIGPWLTRAPGFPGHSPAEFASALRLAYLFAPTRLFVENIDVLVRHRGSGAFERTAHGEVWREFVRDFVPRHPLHWSHRDARADIALVHADDSDFGRGHRPFGNRDATAPATSRSVFAAWHALSHGQLPDHGSCLHIPGYDFPRHELDAVPRSQFPLEAGAAAQTHLHGLFQATRSVLVFDEHVRSDQLADAGLDRRRRQPPPPRHAGRTPRASGGRRDRAHRRLALRRGARGDRARRRRAGGSCTRASTSPTRRRRSPPTPAPPTCGPSASPMSSCVSAPRAQAARRSSSRSRTPARPRGSS